MPLAIVDWDLIYEVNRTRELKEMRWVPVPTKQDGEGYSRLVLHEDGAAHYGCWLGLVIVAAKCPRRGVLVRRDGSAMSCEAIALKCRLPAPLMEQAVARFLEIGWLEEVPAADGSETPIPQEGATIPQEGAASSHECAPTEQDSTEQDSTEEHTLNAEPSSVRDLGSNGQIVPVGADPSPSNPVVARSVERIAREGRTRDPRQRSPWTPDEIEAIRLAYPRRVAKKAAVAAIRKALVEIHGRDGMDADAAAAWLLGRVQAFARSPAGQLGKFTALPATWLNRGSYDDDPAEWQRAGEPDPSGTSPENTPGTIAHYRAQQEQQP